MPKSDILPGSLVTEERVYSPVARFFHWAVATLVLVTAPIGFMMADRMDVKIADEAAKAAFEATTNAMYSWHKLIGVTILLLMIGRWTYRLVHGAPRSEPSLTAAQKGVSHAVHWSLYVLLLAVPIGGYLGIAYGGYLDVFGVRLPSFGIAQNEKLSESVLQLHGTAATILLGFVALHLAGSAYHSLVKGDGVVARMWPTRR
jgi:cytochrome b561